MEVNLLKMITVVLSLVVTGLGLTTQVRKNFERRSTEGLSLFYFCLLAVSYSFWAAYGIAQRDTVLIIPMSVGAVVSWVLVAQFFFLRKK